MIFATQIDSMIGYLHFYKSTYSPYQNDKDFLSKTITHAHAQNDVLQYPLIHPFDK
jgi:hypothetical protein